MARIWDFLGLSLVVWLVGCASPPPPPPQTVQGYKTATAGRDLYRVTYAGTGAASAERIIDFGLARASHLVDSEGYRYFAVINEAKSIGGEVHYYGSDETLENHPSPGNLLIQAFEHRPKRIPCFRAGYTARAIYEKYGMNHPPGAG